VASLHLSATPSAFHQERSSGRARDLTQVLSGMGFIAFSGCAGAWAWESFSLEQDFFSKTI
jgi:hypothetical protein